MHGNYTRHFDKIGWWIVFSYFPVYIYRHTFQPHRCRGRSSLPGGSTREPVCEACESESGHPRRPRGNQSGRGKRRDESFQAQAEKPLGTDSHRTISKRSSECWLLIGHKNALYYCAQSANSISWVLFGEFVHDGYWLDYGLSGSYTKEMHAAVRKLSVWYKLSGIIKIRSTRRLKTLFQKYKPELTTGIHAFIDHAP